MIPTDKFRQVLMTVADDYASGVYRITQRFLLLLPTSILSQSGTHSSLQDHYFSISDAG